VARVSPSPAWFRRAWDMDSESPLLAIALIGTLPLWLGTGAAPARLPVETGGCGAEKKRTGL
jgi:hypothetical protein